MLQSLEEKERHTEGELYKEVELHGRTFALYYGYYDECDRINPLCEPIVIYPDFQKEPVYTDEGDPFVTMMQDVCDNYNGSANRTPDTTCADCKYFERDEEWFGVCKCPYNREVKNE